MRRLVPGQPVTISLDTEDEGIDCRVRTVSGPVALLHRLSDLEPQIEPQLTTGSSCLMSFIHEGSLVGLRGVATTASEDMTELAFVVSDGVQVEERRVAERVELITRARIAAITDHEAGGESPTDTFTADISLGGVRIQHRPGLGAGPGFRVELFFAGDPTPIACEAQLARRTPTHLGLRFIDLPAAERSRLARILTEYQLRARPTA